ncbi:CopG family transcriptional regulator [Sphingomonas histidinilytica]|jgi:predicted RNase H-like HicB family nuclease|uniref:Predicted nuclease of the RNAse H fold, HicB family n=1 Tax=Rhizorhabdus histidinilytica TaxID=439228 RepID=A0A1T4ZXQ1_9SPHN|nr:type II toxin-antitoxin system HicB family antitoxin [Rhizorhabdus histidinilytica]MBO9375956.1 CopG family transcriptional regulator [Rhizorhabdus histidinilytica]QEH78528.1 CopG family transcriptional regulator [Sphingomonas sp. C8-2]SKB27500.1 Predicted nuclease of the RNAse H fold, HicB family [Rhizorhabdus histidinilytica]
MKYFYAIVHKDEDSAYGVHFPDLPGCFSAADDLDDVVPNAVEAMELWLEDQAEPTASSVTAIREQAAKDLAEGAFLIAVPRMTTSGKLTRVNLSLDMGTLAAIDMAARDRKLTRSAFLAEAARNEIQGRH